MGTNYQATVYRPRLEDGQRFQDFIGAELYRVGIVIVNFQSREYQYRHGENLLGLEVKFDDRVKTTGNLFIEVEERADPANPRWVASGIDRGDAWLYGIGNYQEFWIFATRHLQAWRTRYQPVIVPNNTNTGRGFLLSRAQAGPLCARSFTFAPDATGLALDDEVDF